MKHHYIVPVIEAYQLFNTIKGIELVTPNDFIKACRCLQSLNSKVKLKELENKVMILYFSEFETLKHFNQMIVPLLK